MPIVTTAGSGSGDDASQLERLEGRPSFWQLLILFAIGIYGGFIQAGVGIFLLASLVLGIGYDLVRANPVKNFIVLLFTISASDVNMRSTASA